MLWALGNTIDTRGNFNRQLWGNGVITQTGFDANSGLLSSIKSGRLSNTNQVNNLYGDIQNLSYTFDSLGNLYSRTSTRTNNSGTVLETITENFAYDKLNRLTHSTTSGLFGRTQTYQYDSGGLGNLVNRTDTLTGSSTNNDVGTLAYDRVRNAGIHAVTSAGGINYSYDKYGNMTARGSETITYDVFNKPTRIAGTTTTDFFYGPDHELYKQVSGGVTTYKLAGGVYEVIVNGSTTTQKSYVDGVILNTRTLVNGAQTANDTQYLHTDHLGSTEAITNALGQFVSRMSFSTWGERQKSDWKPGPLTSTELNTYNTITTNGYTGHDQLDSHNLIHMGGRVYDPNLGRFLSADLFIQSPYDSQSYNRYSYTFNNPLSYTDPSGYLNDKSGKSPSQQNFNYAFHQAVSGCDNSGCTTVGHRPGGVTQDQLMFLSQLQQWGSVFGSMSVPQHARMMMDFNSAVNGLPNSNELLDQAAEDALKEIKADLADSPAKAIAVDVLMAAVVKNKKNSTVQERKNGKALETGDKKTSKIDRTAFKSQRESYWKEEAKKDPSKYSAENLERMKQGKAPIGEDGFPMELHHVDRTMEGELKAMTRTDHRLGENYKINHPN